ncbi:MAG: hypothetical protein WD871_05120 [Xanthobacteraceae bacterium]
MLWNVNGSESTDTSTYSSPSSSNASDGFVIGTRGGAGDFFLTNGSRLAMLAVWEGAALSAADLESIRNATRGRLGL